jgi:hypothetical protein
MMKQQYSTDGWDPYENMHLNGNFVRPYAEGADNMQPDYSGTNGINEEIYCGAGSSLMDDNWGATETWASMANANQNKYTKNFRTPGVYPENQIPSCEPDGEAR